MSDPIRPLTPSVTTYVVREQSPKGPYETLLVYNKTLKIWLPPGGIIKEGEDPNIAARRAVLEETGLIVSLHEGHMERPEIVPNGTSLIAPRFLERAYSEVLGKELLDMGFVATCGPHDPITLSEEIERYYWCTDIDLAKRIPALKPNIKHNAFLALRMFL